MKRDFGCETYKSWWDAPHTGGKPAQSRAGYRENQSIWAAEASPNGCGRTNSLWWDRIHGKLLPRLVVGLAKAGENYAEKNLMNEPRKCIDV